MAEKIEKYNCVTAYPFNIKGRISSFKKIKKYKLSIN